MAAGRNDPMHLVKWVAGAVGVVALIGVCLIVSMTLMPPEAEAQTKGTFVPWLITWGMIWLTAAMGLIIAGYMVAVGLGKLGSD
jgi:hypothetical protein